MNIDIKNKGTQCTISKSLSLMTGEFRHVKDLLLLF